MIKSSTIPQSYHLSKKNVQENYLPPISFEDLSDDEVINEIHQLKQELSSQVLILGHHYQQDDVIAFADDVGDSLQLARSAQKSKAANIIFCGVHFMAETADMLTSHTQKVMLPDLNAGCSMADMAQERHVERAWKEIAEAMDTVNSGKKIVPITYINCSAKLKAFVGKQGGAICTSSNAKKIIEWALEHGDKLFFFPDQHLGRNTCFELGISLEDMVVYDPNKFHGGLTEEQIKKAKVILWYGYCSVHQGFKIEQIQNLRSNEPDRKIIVHPECNFEVTQAADLRGSTSFIVSTLEAAKAGSKFAVGTEINLVNRLAKKFPSISIISLSPYQCLCTTMYRIRPRWLLNSLRSIKNETCENVITVDLETTKWSLLALDRMLELS
ncbi:MAG: quinolinate synthase NadA [Bacteriovoracaceae bacterium]|nr:quinolinate synthase NadA [Bacteriovoracaceae bacterium]